MISLQYGGSNAHDKIEITKGNKKGKDIMTTILRHYNNTFTDKVKQEAFNIYLGVFRPMEHSFILHTNTNKANYDYYLHNCGYKQHGEHQLLPREKWWFAPILAYETSIYGDPWKPLHTVDSNDHCPYCKQSPITTHALLCARCGSLLRHSLPSLSQSCYYDFGEESHFAWERLIAGGKK